MVFNEKSSELYSDISVKENDEIDILIDRKTGNLMYYVYKDGITSKLYQAFEDGELT